MRKPVIDFYPCPALDEALVRTANNPDGAGFNQMLRAVADRKIALTAVMDPRRAWSPRSLKSSLPTIVLIGDDFGDSRDPDQWRCAISAIAWAKAAVVHGTGAEAAHYATAVAGAQIMQRVLFIETDSFHSGAWINAILPRKIPLLSIAPPAGKQHPAEAQS